jgi:hypothetical protein
MRECRGVARCGGGGSQHRGSLLGEKQSTANQRCQPATKAVERRSQEQIPHANMEDSPCCSCYPRTTNPGCLLSPCHEARPVSGSGRGRHKTWPPSNIRSSLPLVSHHSCTRVPTQPDAKNSETYFNTLPATVSAAIQAIRAAAARSRRDGTRGRVRTANSAKPTGWTCGCVSCLPPRAECQHACYIA